MRSILVGAVESTRTALETMVEAGHRPAALVTLPGSSAQRHSDWVDLAILAARWEVPVVEAKDVNAPEVITRLREVNPDHVFVIGWSQICRAEVLDLAASGAVGFHPAKLPLNRGRAVIPWTILQEAEETGTTLFWMDEGMDTGDILAQRSFPVASDESARSLYDKHLAALREMLLSTLPAMEDGTPPRRAQDHASATYCSRRTAEDGRIDWRSPARTVWTLIRATGTPYPGAFAFTAKGRITVWDATLVGPAPYWGLPGQVQTLGPAGALVQCGDGDHVLLKTVQVEAGERQPAANVLRTHEHLVSHDRWRST